MFEALRRPEESISPDPHPSVWDRERLPRKPRRKPG